ncbi:MAG TPA: NAD(P)-binding domain-containing protein [Solirubrobacteraceae bacterium]|nr:NAD(P)-binding domain-containing protein [Solirubrobacteraceae bacterium]
MLCWSAAGFLPRDGVVGHLERYASRLPAPVHEGVEVRSVAPQPGGGFRLETSDGELLARAVVVCTGAYQRPHRPPIAGALPEGVTQLGSDGYTAPGNLPPGPVLVVGSAQSGCQIAEELRESGREVFLACGRAAWSSRRIGDRDLIWWAQETGYLDQPVGALPSPWHGSRATSSPRGTAAGTICTCARCTRWACACSAASRAAPGHTPASPTTSPRASHGAHFLRKRKSSLLVGVGEDAAIVADGIAAAG